jgi:hypothetical protein
VKAALDDLEPLVDASASDAVNKPVSLVYAPRPPSLPLAFERLGLTRPSKWVSTALLDQHVQSAQRLAISLDPMLVVLPGEIVEDDLHG